MISAKFRVTALAICMVITGEVAQAGTLKLQSVDSAVTRDGGSSRGVAWGDFDNDGDADLAVSNTNGQPLFLYRNEGGGRFIAVPEPFGGYQGNSEGIAWIDFDNDGRIDLFVARTDGPNLLFRNEGGTFIRFDAGPLTGDDTVSSQGCWADFDNDSWLDVFVVNRAGQDDVLYRNVRGKTFKAIRAPFAGRGGDGRTCAAGDVNNDGRPDLYVGNFLSPGETPPRKAENFFYLNAGKGFREVVRGHLVNTPSLTYGASFADFDEDGDLDLFITNIALSDRNLLYENLGNARFYPREDLAPSTDSLGPSKGHSWGDFDNDGDLDIIVAEGTENITAEQEARGYDPNNRLYLNDGKGRFAPTDGAFTTHVHISAGTAWADHDGDGDLDIAVANWGGNAENNALYENHSGGNHISFVLQGRRSNRQGIGAQIVITARFEGGKHVQRRWLWPQTGYASMNESVLHFGLGSAKKVDRIRIFWPSGIVDDYDERPANVRYLVIEGKSLRETVPNTADRESTQ